MSSHISLLPFSSGIRPFIKVTILRELYPNMDIQVDGGVGPSNIHVCAEAGSNVIVAGSAIFGAKDSKQVISQIRAAVDQAIEKRSQKA